MKRKKKLLDNGLDDRAQENRVAVLGLHLVQSFAEDAKGTLAAILTALSYYSKGEEVVVYVAGEEVARVTIPEDVKASLKGRSSTSKVN